MPEMKSFEELMENGRLVIAPRGWSMWPLVKNGRDSVLIEPLEGRCKKYDIPLYKDRAGRYIVHRIIKVTEDGYVICGDGVYFREYDIKDENILGVVKGIYRKERFVSVESKLYKLYSRVWVGLIFVRKPIIILSHKCRWAKLWTCRQIRKIFKKRSE